MKTAVILFNLGGPDSLDAVQPFLFNLFNDPAIISLPWPLRTALAKLISNRRTEKAKGIYAQMGGKSPILEQTRAQAEKLEAALNFSSPFQGEVAAQSAAGGGYLSHFTQEKDVTLTPSPPLEGGRSYRTFITMRYWHPFADETAVAVKDYAPDRIILLPLYPQFSTTTTGSSVKDWHRAAKKIGLAAPTKTLCCYPTDPHFIAAHAANILHEYAIAEQHGRPRILFSAHGLPEKVIAGGDPYQWQVEQTVAAVVAVIEESRVASRESREANATRLESHDSSHAFTDYQICYQSRVGPLKWIGPSTESEIIRAAEDGVPIILVPIAFVSEHSETLVELDIEYKHLAQIHGCEHYFRVPALGVGEWFIEALAELCRLPFDGGAVCSGAGARVCPKEFSGCPNRASKGNYCKRSSANQP